MALAEQRARHVKESVVIREQRHTLALKEPGFAVKLAKLFGWTDAGGSPTSKSPFSVSPIRSRSVSPIGSPTNTRRKGGDDCLDDTAVIATHAEHGVTDVVVGRTELSKRLELLDTPTVEIFGDGASKGNGMESQARAPALAGIADPAVSLIVDSAHKEESPRGSCPRCTRLHQELETALTDRTLAEAELVSLRRTMSQVDTAWECESSGAVNFRPETEQAHFTQPHREGDTTGEAVPPLPSAIIDGDLGIRDELGRLEKSLASLGEDDIAPPTVDGNAVEGQGLPKLRVSHRFPMIYLTLPETWVVLYDFRLFGQTHYIPRHSTNLITQISPSITRHQNISTPVNCFRLRNSFYSQKM